MERQKNTLLECATLKLRLKIKQFYRHKLHYVDCKLKIQGFFQAPLKKKHFSRSSRPGTKNLKIQGFPGFPGGV